MNDRNNPSSIDDLLDSLITPDEPTDEPVADFQDLIDTEINNDTSEEEEPALDDDVMVSPVAPVAQPSFSLKKALDTAQNIAQRLGIPDMLLLRVIAAYFFIFGNNIRLLREEEIYVLGNWKEFVAEISLSTVVWHVLLGILVLTAVHSLLPKRWRIVDQFAAITGTLYFSIALLWRQNNVYLSIGVMVAAMILIAYAVGKLRSHRLPNKIPWQICGVITLAIGVFATWFIILISILRHDTFGSMVHDFGLFVQMFHSLAEDLTAMTTCERDMLMSHFEVHASYIYYLLVPFFKLFPYEETLLIAQGILAMGGIVPLFLIAKRRGFKGLSLIFIGAMYAFSSALIAPCFYDFHETAFLPTLLMWTLWAVDSKKYIPFFVFSALTCIVKEDAPLYIICIGLYLFFEHKGTWKRLYGLIAAGCAGIYMMRITQWLTEHGDGQMMASSRFGHLLIDPEGGLVEVVTNSLSNPGYLFSLMIQEGTLLFFVQIMLPLLFMPFFTKKIHRFLLMIPFVITNLIIGANYGYAANINFQYIFGPATLLIFMAVINVDDFSPRTRQDIPILLGSAALLMSVGTQSHHIDKYENYQDNKEAYIKMEATLDAIPKDAVVAADPFIIPHIADREEVYIYDFADVDKNAVALIEPDKYDFIVLKPGTEITMFAEPLLGNAGYVKVQTDVSDRINIYMNTAYTIN